MITKATVTSALILAAGAAIADGGHAITSGVKEGATPSFDILQTQAVRDGSKVTFTMATNGVAGADKPTPVGQLGGAPAYAYVWPTSLDPSSVGFEEKAGILALAAATHPDFDDTPLFDENGDGDLENDGDHWHSHWVVLAPTEACGPGALAVKDIPEGETPAVPVTWPGLPILLDSPGYAPKFDGPSVTLTVPFNRDVELSGVAYDGVTSALRVNANIHAPLFCVTDVFDVASGDLSLPGSLN